MASASEEMTRAQDLTYEIRGCERGVLQKEVGDAGGCVRLGVGGNIPSSFGLRPVVEQPCAC